MGTSSNDRGKDEMKIVKKKMVFPDFFSVRRDRNNWHHGHKYIPPDIYQTT
jgi:hypothetical protein